MNNFILFMYEILVDFAGLQTFYIYLICKLKLFKYIKKCKLNTYYNFLDKSRTIRIFVKKKTIKTLNIETDR